MLISKLAREPQASSFICLPSAGIKGAYCKALAPQCCSCMSLLQGSGSLVCGYRSILQGSDSPMLPLCDHTARLWLPSAAATGAYCKALTAQCCGWVNILQGPAEDFTGVLIRDWVVSPACEHHFWCHFMKLSFLWISVDYVTISHDPIRHTCQTANV